MTLGAHVGSVDALLRLRASLRAFISAADKALCEAAIEIDRTADWISHDQQAFWTAEARKRHDAVIKAQDEVRRAQWTIGDHKPAAIEQKKALKKAEERLAEAKQKLANVARWKREFAQAANEYKGQVQHMASALDADLPHAVGVLDQILDSISSYLAVAAPPGSADEIPGLETANSSMAQPLPRRRGLEPPDERAALMRGIRERAERIARDAVLVDRGLTINKTATLSDSLVIEAPDSAIGPCRPGDLVLVERPAFLLDRDDLFFVRLRDPGQGDSGWHIGRIGSEPGAGDIVATTAARLALLRPDWRNALSAPHGSMLLIRDGAAEWANLPEDRSTT